MVLGPAYRWLISGVALTGSKERAGQGKATTPIVWLREE